MDMNKKIYINPKQYGMLKESEWNFHVNARNGGKEHDMKPYGSDTKYSMAGRETGHFGSGTYFSTYKDNDSITKYGGSEYIQNPNFIQISDKLYRVDFDIYKNLYRVKSKRQGDILYTMCTELNHMYNKIAYGGKFNSKEANYDNSENYQIIRRNAESLGLRCPSYYELTRMAQRHEGDQSFSTLFMEWNGYNGVNVSGVEYYDNTKHGSVIYDLSKTSSEMQEVNTNIPYMMNDQPYNNTVAYDRFGDKDAEIQALKGEYIGWYDNINEYPIKKSLRILKNYTKSGHVLSPFVMDKMDDELLSKYLGILYSSCFNGRDRYNSYGDYSDGNISLNNWFDSSNRISDEMLGDKCKWYVRLIDRVGAYYWVNLISDGKSMLTEILWEFSNNLSWSLSVEEENAEKKVYIDKVMPYLKRDLTDYEKQFIREDYYGD